MASGASLRHCPRLISSGEVSEQAPSFEVISIVVRRAIRTEAIGFFRIETCLRETYQLAGQDQEAAVGEFPRTDIELD